MDDYDEFNDVQKRTDGIFATGTGGLDDALKRFGEAQVDVSRAGVTVDVPCPMCGRVKQVTFEWPEMVAIRCEISPDQAYAAVPQLRRYGSRWRYVGQEGGERLWAPEGIRCGRCPQGMIEPMFSPQECTRYILRAKDRGQLTEQEEVGLGSVCRAAQGR